MSKGRIYHPLRRAYFPRLWPMVLVACPLNFALLWLLQPHGVAMVAIALGVGLGVPLIRIAVFQHRHPKMTPEEYLQGRRDKATWN